MKILITGATGLIGTTLSQRLFELGHQIFIVTRSPKNSWKHCNVPHTTIQWPLQDSDLSKLSEIEAVYNLMGESIASGRWTEKKKKSLIQSRVDSTKDLFKILEKADAPLKTWINASAIGIYGTENPETCYDESHPAGVDFLAQLGKAWEDAVIDSTYTPNSNLRKVMLRIGVVLSTEGGALQKMLPAFENHVGGRLSHGQQWFSWIHIDDMIKVLLTTLDDDSYSGAYNAVSPEPIRNVEFTKCLGETLKKATIIPAPGFALKLALGEMSTLLLDGHQVQPKKLLEKEFQFQYPTLRSALEHLLKGREQNTYKLETSLWLPKPKEEVFEFFSEAKHLEDITPDLLQFKIESMSTDTIQEGTTFIYNLKIHGIPKKWKSLIERWDPPDSFVDTQLEGPYNYWHHTHHFVSLHGGTLMTDTVLYQPPLGPFGRLANLLFIRKDLEKIFQYRRKKIIEVFAT